MTVTGLQAELDAQADELGVPGAAAAVVHDGRATYAFTGVTSVDNPLAVDEGTLFQFGSTGKTYTATAIMRLVERGEVDLDAPVRTYVPELRLRDEDVAQRVSVLQLLNHTAGWDGDLMEDMGNGDDALARYVARMATIEQVSPLGAAVSYNNASLSLAGRIIEKVTGTTYERAVEDLLLAPLGMDSTFFFAHDVMTRRFCVGHQRHDDGRTTVMRPPYWGIPRGNAPAGGMSATARDQITWARFHLGDGTAAGGARLLSSENVRRMQQPTASMAGSALGDAVGIGWLLEEVAGATVVKHGGTTHGQHSAFVMVPEHDFAVTVMTNSEPGGPRLNDRVVAWALERCLDLVAVEPTPVRLPADRLRAYTGRYETIASYVEVTAADGWLSAAITPKPGSPATAVAEQGEDAAPEPPLVLGLLEASGDAYVVERGDAKGMRGYFTRAGDGQVDGVHLGGRLATRVVP